MSIARLCQVTLVGQRANKSAMLAELQRFGGLHVYSHARKGLTASSDVIPEPVGQAVMYLKSCPAQRRQVKHASEFDQHKVLRQVLENQHQRTAQLALLDTLRERREALLPWGNFTFAPAEEMAGYRLWFYLVPNYQLAMLNNSELAWQCVHKDHRYHYIVVIHPTEPNEQQIPFTRSHTGTASLALIEQQIEQAEITLEAIDAERVALTRWLHQLVACITTAQDEAALTEVQGLTDDSEHFFVLLAWVKKDAVQRLHRFCQQHAIVCVTRDPEPNEHPPTLLHNPEAIGGAEQIVRFFQLPSYHSWDPSRVVFFSFAAFFAMILSDAGYALLLLLLTGAKWKTWQGVKKTRRLSRLLLTMALFSLVWGITVGSYFGGAPPAEVLAAMVLVNMQDFDAMMRLSVSIGVAHLVLANAMMAYVRRRHWSAIASLGWAVTCVLMWHAWQYGYHAGHLLLGIVCLVAIILFTGESGSEWQWQQRWRGLVALTQVTQLFGDALSYLRLFALGLASASLAMTFNQLATDVAHAVPGLGLLLQIVLLLIGHALNFVLTLVSGVIHGLRLNLIEFYHWSLADEGYAFQPFAKQEETPWTT